MIVQGFEIKHYTVLDCNGRRHTLTIAAEQKLDGNSLRKCRGSLYLCEKAMEVCSYIRIYIHVTFIYYVHKYIVAS